MFTLGAIAIPRRASRTHVSGIRSRTLEGTQHPASRPIRGQNLREQLLVGDTHPWLEQLCETFYIICEVWALGRQAFSDIEFSSSCSSGAEGSTPTQAPGPRMVLHGDSARVAVLKDPSRRQPLDGVQGAIHRTGDPMDTAGRYVYDVRPQ